MTLTKLYVQKTNFNHEIKILKLFCYKDIMNLDINILFCINK